MAKSTRGGASNPSKPASKSAAKPASKDTAKDAKGDADKAAKSAAKGTDTKPSQAAAARTRRTGGKPSPVTIDLKAESVATTASQADPAQTQSDRAVDTPPAPGAPQDGVKDVVKDAAAGSTEGKATEKAASANASSSKTSGSGVPKTARSTPTLGRAGAAAMTGVAGASVATKDDDKAKAAAGKDAGASATPPKTGSAETKTPPPAAPPPAKKSGHGFGALAGAALLGAVLALIGGWFLGLFGGSAETDRLAALNERVAAIESGSSTAPATVDEAQIRPVVDNALAEALPRAVSSALSERVPAAVAEALDADLDARIATAVAEAASASVPADETGDAPATGNAASADALAQLREDVDALRTALAARTEPATQLSSGDAATTDTNTDNSPSLAAAGIATALAPVSSRVSTLSDDLAGLSARVEKQAAKPVATPEDVSALRTSLSELRDDLTARIEPLAALPDRVGTLDGAVSQVSETLTGVNEAVSGMGETIAAVKEDAAKAVEQAGEARSLAATVSERLDNGADRRAARAIAAASLKAAADRGGPFEVELDTLRQTAGDDAAALDRLAPFAAEGVPTLATLSRRFAEQRAAIVAAGTPAVAEDAGAMDRLFAGARSLVQVTPKGPQEGDDPAAIASRIAGALDDGNAEAAQAQFKTLPEASQAEGQAFADALAARLALDETLATTLRSALAGDGAG